jgi:hypothetical protein
MARVDKAGGKGCNYRATLAADWLPANVEKILGVGHDANGRLVIGAGQSGIKGVIILTKAYAAGKRIDVFVHGEIVEFGPSDVGKVPGTDFGVAGQSYYADPTNGVITATKPTNGVYVGHTIEGQRLFVDVSPV